MPQERRPRFEMRAVARRAAERGGNGRLGLSTVQGVVSGLKLYAATHAGMEGKLPAQRMHDDYPR